MKCHKFTLKFGAKNKEKFVTPDIFEVIPFSVPLCKNLFGIFLDSGLKTHDFIGGFQLISPQQDLMGQARLKGLFQTLLDSC